MIDGIRCLFFRSDGPAETMTAGRLLNRSFSRLTQGAEAYHAMFRAMFSAVFVSRGVVNLWYGRKKKLQSIAIGTVWVPGQSK